MTLSSSELISFSSSPSLAQSFVQVCPDGVQKVGGVDIVHVKFDAEEKDKEDGDSGFMHFLK